MECLAQGIVPAEEIQTVKKYSAELMEIFTKQNVPGEEIQTAIRNDLTEWMKTQ